MSEDGMDDWGFDLHALYRIYDPFGRPLYFGETDNLPRRLGEHMEKAWFRRPEITIKVTWYPNRAEALAAESGAIAAEKPWHNKAGLKPNATRAAAEPKRRPEPVVRDVLADVLNVLGDAPGLPWTVLAERLAATFPVRWGKVTSLVVSAECRALGVPSVDVKFSGKAKKGCRRSDVQRLARPTEGRVRPTAS